MPKATFVAHDGATTTLDVEVGNTLMMAAVFDGVAGIEGICGGCLSCASCHVYVPPEWLARLTAPSVDENTMLEMVASERRPNSRLACQITMSEALDGIVVEMPERQS